MQHPERVERAASLIQQADALVFAAGAGMGVDSGLPVRHFNQQFQRTTGARLIRINPCEADVSNALDVALPVGALEALIALDVLLAPQVNGGPTP